MAAMLTRKEVAEKLNIGKDKVADIPYRDLPFIRIGYRTVRYKETDVLDFVRKIEERTRREEMRR